MGNYAGAKQWNKNTKQAAEALDKLNAKHKAGSNVEYWSDVGLPGSKKKRMSEMDDADYARTKALNDIEEEQDVQKQRIVDEYPKGTVDEEGRKSRNTQGYGKEPKFAKGGKVSSASKRADGCAVRGKTRA